MRTAPRIDDPRCSAFLLQEELRVTRNARRKIGWQRKRFIKRVCMERLRMALRCGHRFYFGADHIIKNILRGERPARCLAMRTQRQALLTLRVELFDELGPEKSRGAKLCNFHEEIHTNRPEE